VLTAYRRHRDGCPHASDRSSRKCRCALWCDGTVEGEHVRKSLKTRSWERAQKLLREIEDRKQGAQTISAPNISEAIKKFMLDAEHGRKIKPATLKKYKVLLAQLETFTDRERVSKLKDITVDFAREFRASWHDGSISSSKKLERLRSFLRFCVLSGWIPSNPAESVAPPVIKTPPTLPFTEKEIQAILAKANDPRWHALVNLMRWSGLAIGDAMQLTESKLHGNRLFLRREKTNVDVFVPIPEYVVTELNSLPKYGGYFFWKREGESKLETATGNARRSLRKIFKAAGVRRGHPHRFRDTFSVALLEKGVAIEVVARLLGNTEKVCRKHYAPWVKSLQDNLEREVQKTWEKPALRRVK